MSKELIERLREAAAQRVASTAMIGADDLIAAADALESLGADRDSWERQAGDRLDDVLRVVAERDALAAEMKALPELRAAEEWMPIETAPECMCVVVGWHETEDGEHSGRYDFDMKDEDGCWLNHEDSYQHFCAVAPPGSTGPKEIAPYTHWRKVPPVPRHGIASPATQLAAEGATK